MLPIRVLAGYRLEQVPGLPGMPGPAAATSGTTAPVLVFGPEGVLLDDGHSKPLRVDFTAPALRRRIRQRSLAGEALARACGLGGGRRPLIIDCTAGFAEDALLLAAFGCQVHLLEGSPEVCLLLADGLQRARAEPSLGAEIVAALSRMQLHWGRAEELLADHSGAGLVAPGTVLYLDPMFPAPGKARRRGSLERLAAVAVAGGDDLLAAALASPAARVVVKRPRRANPLQARDPQQPANPMLPSHSLGGRSVRFDVYARERLATPGDS